MAEQLCNRASTVLGGAISSGQTTITVAGNIGFPGTGNFRIRIEAELLLVTSISSLTWTVTRGIEGTNAASHPSSTKVTAVLSAGGLEQYIAEQIAAAL